MTVKFEDVLGKGIKVWPNWPKELIPQTGDTVLLHYGINNEIEAAYEVTRRVISDTDPDSIVVRVDRKY